MSSTVLQLSLDKLKICFGQIISYRINVFFQFMCIRNGVELSCNTVNLLVLLIPFRAAGAQDVEFVSIPGKIQFIC